MSKSDYNLIVAVDSNWGMAKDKQIPWYSTTDFKYFKKVTKDSVCLYGRSTHDEIFSKLGKELLPGRKNIVVTSTPVESNAIRCDSLNSALFEHAKRWPDMSLFFCGGPRIYEESFKHVKTAYVTTIESIYNCDTFFPSENFLKLFVPVEKERVMCKSLDKYITFRKYERVYETK